MNAFYIELTDCICKSKLFRVLGIMCCGGVFCLTLFWNYKRRHDSGFGLFRLAIGTFAEYDYKRGIVIDTLGLSIKWLRGRKHPKYGISFAEQEKEVINA